MRGSDAATLASPDEREECDFRDYDRIENEA